MNLSGAAPRRSTSPPHPPACAARVVVRSGDPVARGSVASEAASTGISSGLVTALARCARRPAVPASRVSRAATATYADRSRRDVVRLGTRAIR